MTGFKFDHKKEGLAKSLKKYEEIALRYVWSIGEEGTGSGKTWKIVNERLGSDRTISRASICFFMTRMVDQGVLGYRTKSGKGGYHRMYYPLLDESAYKKHLLKTLVDSRLRDFPDVTREALGELQSYLEGP